MRLMILFSSLIFSFSVSAASLTLAPEVQLVSVNGKPITAHTSFIDIDGGQHVLSLRYRDFHEHGPEEHEIVRSDVHIVQFSAIENTHYQIMLPDMDIEQAYQFAAEPVFPLTETSGSIVDYKQWGRDQLLAELLLNE